MTRAAEGNRRKGFATFSPERRREIASRGGKAVQARGTGHKWTSETAAIAGRLGVSHKRAKHSAEIAGEEAVTPLQHHLTRFWLEVWRIGSLTRLYMTERGLSEQEAMAELMSLADVPGEEEAGL
jgi:hypothetical protein